MKRRKFRFRAFTALMMLWSFVLETVSGVILYIVPPGRIAHWTNWKLWGFTKDQWGAMHTIFGYVFLIFAVLHIYYNWKPILSYIKAKVKLGLRIRMELAVSLLITLVVFFATIISIPPFSAVMDLGENFRNSWEESRNEPFVPHAELMSFEEFVKQIGIPDEQALQRLKNSGIEVKNRNALIKDIAKENEVAPSDIHDLLIKSLPREEKERMAEAVLHPSTGAGFGMKSLEQIAGELDMPVEDAINILKSREISAQKNDLIKDIAEKSGKRPFEIIEILRQR
jgi:signal transduction histidine kinase